MMLGCWRLYAALVIAMLSTSTGCALQQRQPPSASASPTAGETTGSANADASVRPVSCDAEAGLLITAVSVFAAPERGSHLIAELDAGTPINRCEKRGGWFGIMFPRAGEKADCSRRTATAHCSTGWVYGEVEIDILG